MAKKKTEDFDKEEEKREQLIMFVSESMRTMQFSFEVKVKKKPAGIKIIYEVTKEEMGNLIDILSGDDHGKEEE